MCPICNKKLSGKQKYCSGACRVKASRTSEGAPSESQDITESPKYTKADKVFLERVAHMGPTWPRPGEVAENICNNCEKPFKTQFDLLRHCGC